MEISKNAKKKFLERLAFSLDKYEVTDKNQIAYIIATVEWETNHTYTPVKEAYWLSEKWRKNHLKYYPYYGRGFVQITWKENYLKFAKLLGIDLVNEPDLALEFTVAMDILVLGFRDGLFTGRNLNRYTKASGAFDFVGARHIINGKDKAHTIASMAKTYLA